MTEQMATVLGLLLAFAGSETGILIQAWRKGHLSSTLALTLLPLNVLALLLLAILFFGLA